MKMLSRWADILVMIDGGVLMEIEICEVSDDG